MTSNKTIEERLTAVEKAVAELQRRLSEGRPSPNWVDSLGPVTDDEVFRKVIEYGREFRYADRPSDEPDDLPDASAR